MASVEHFDEWAITYDDDLRTGMDQFPFAGYDTVLDALVALVQRSDATRVLDLGIGTGTLAHRLVEASPHIEVWGVDFSAEMLERAKRKVPAAHLIHADLDQDLPGLSLPCFDVVVSSYVLHELPDERKCAIINHLLEHRLEPAGVLGVGDIAFADESQQDAIRRATQHWDDTEHYFIADVFLRRVREQDISGDYCQLSPCAGVFTFRSLTGPRSLETTAPAW